MLKRAATLLIVLFATPVAMAQGEDSTPFERDLQLVTTLLEGGFDNANQAYFDSRIGGGRDLPYDRYEAVPSM